MKNLKLKKKMPMTTTYPILFSSFYKSFDIYMVVQINKKNFNILKSYILKLYEKSLSKTGKTLHIPYQIFVQGIQKFLMYSKML